MVDTEAKPPGGTGPEAKGTTPPPPPIGKTLGDRIREMLADFEKKEKMEGMDDVEKTTIERLKEERSRNVFIKHERLQAKSADMRMQVRTLVDNMQRNPKAPIDGLPDFTRDILVNSIKIGSITNESAPVLYELIRVSQLKGAAILTPDGVNSALEAILAVSDFEPFTARKIIEKILEKADGFPVTDTIKNARKKLPDYRETAEERDRRQKQIKNKRQEREAELLEAISPIKGITLTQAAQDRIRNKTIAEYRALGGESGTITTFVDEVIRERIEAEQVTMQQNIAGALNTAVAAYASPDQRKALGEYKSILSRLRVADMISPEDYQMLIDLYGDPVFTAPIIREQKKMEGQDIVERARGIFVPTQEQERILMGLSSAQSFEYLIKTATEVVKDASGNPMKDAAGNIIRRFRYLNDDARFKYRPTGPNGEFDPDEFDFTGAKINWKAFMEDVKGIFGGLLSIADRNPNQQFEQAFNPMYEGHLYQQLLQRISHLGSQIDSSDNEFFKSQKIEIKGQITDRKPSTPDNPGQYLMHEKTQQITLSEAIGGYLANEMNDYKMVRSLLHNVNYVCTIALGDKGWDQLKQFAETLDMYKIDKLMRQEEYLGLAANFYSAALQQEIAANGKVTTAELGLGDERYQLNSAERKAFFQMKAVLHKKHPELSDSALNQQAIQKIRMVAGIAYGVTGEFWNIMLTARMPIGTKEGKDNATGEKVNEVSALYMGTHHAGYESMIATLDLDLLLQRFGLPKFYNDLRYVTRYRDMHHPPNPYSPEGYWHHGLNSEARIQIEDAMVNGRSDRLIEMDERYAYFSDYMRTKCVGLFARGGWRFGNADAYTIYTDAERKKVDYVKTYAEVRLMGSFITKKFLDDNLSGINSTMVKALYPGAYISPEDKTILDKTAETHNQKKKKRELIYKYLLFPQIVDVTPSKYLQLEERRWTPRGEKLLRDDLCAYLLERYGEKTYPKEILNQHVYNMYVSALTLAEKSAWTAFREKVAAAKKAGLPIPDVNGYVFDNAKFAEHSEELKELYKQFKIDLGQHDSFGKTIKIEEEFEEFMDILKGFHGRLRSSINAPRFHNESGRGQRESLEQRFAYNLTAGGGNANANGNIENLIAGDDFDMERFYFGASGGRSAVRFLGETKEIATVMNPAVKDILNDVLPDIIKGQYKDIHAFEKVIQEKLVPQFKKIHGAIAMMDKNQADEYCISLALFITNMIGKDRIMRIKGIGGLIDWSRRTRNGSQSSTYTDFFVNTLKRPTHALDSDELFAMGHLIFNAINMPFSDRIVDHVEVTKNIFGIPVGTKTVFKDEVNVEYEIKKLWGLIPYKSKKLREGDYHEWHAHVFDHAAGLAGAAKWIENYIPMAAGAILMIMIAMAYLAAQKNKKK